MDQRKTPELKPLFIERMQKLLTDKKDFEAYLDILKILPVKSIRCNTIKISPSDLKKKLEGKGWKIKQPWEKHKEVMIVEGKIAHADAFEIKTNNKKTSNNKGQLITPLSTKLSFTNSKANSLGESLALSRSMSERSEPKLLDLEPGELGRSLEHLLGYYYIQELASMLPIIALKPEKGEMILDLCAAPGSKTTQIAAELQNTGTIIANELSFGRIKILASNLERCGVTNTIITKKEGAALCKRLKMQGILFDKILVDAPCSGEGTLRSSPKTYVMWNIKTVMNLPRIQKNLVKAAFEILKPGGELVYSTCTHAPEENEGVVDSILKEIPELKMEKINLPVKCRDGITKWEDETYSKEVKKVCRVYPHDDNTEGFFVAKFRREK